MELKTKYLSIAIKKQIIDEIILNSIVEKNGMKFIDNINKQLAIDLSLVQFYTDINIAETNMDTLYEDGTIDEIRKAIPYSELNFIEENVYYALEEEKEIYNSLSSVINRSLQVLISKIPDEKAIQKILKSVPSTLNKLTPESKELFKGIIDGKLK